MAMAAVSLTRDDCMDDSDEGFEQGDCSVGAPEDDASLPPLVRLQKYAHSSNVFDRQMVARLIQDLFRTCPPDVLTENLPEIMKTLTNIGDESILRADLLDQIPHIAAQAVESSSRVEALKNVVGSYLIPLVVRNLGYSDAAVDRAAHATLINLIEQGFITKQQAEIQVCPVILALSKVETSADVNTGAITLMSKLVPLLGRDITERVFLKRFIDLCSSPMFLVRKVCAAHFGEFCNVVGKDAFENILLPCYINLCHDEAWGVRKACAEVIMFISCACPPAARKLLLAPVFIKMLQDDCRWVRISAFQALGPFISTFADPTITNVGYNKGGDLVLRNREGSEFMMNRSCNVLSISEKYLIDMNNDKEEDTNYNSIPLNSESVNLNDAEPSELEEKKDEWYFEGLLKIQEMLDEETTTTTTTTSDTNVICQKKCDTTLADTVNSELKDEMENLKLIVDNVNVENSDVTEHEPSQSSVNCLDLEEGVVEATNIKLEDGDKKVIVTNSGFDSVGDDLHSFNSHSYWYISPDLPLDPFIVSGGQSASAVDGSGDVASHLEKLYSTINLNDTFNITTNTNDSTISLEENSSLCEDKNPNLTRTVIKLPPDQDVVPQELIDHYVSMTDPGLAVSVDYEITSYHCAYSLPAVASTLGSNNWHLLKNTVDALAGHMQYKVRKIVASSLHELALILGPEAATTCLTPLFDGFIKDLDEVRIGVLQHLAIFLNSINPVKRNTYLPRLAEFLQTDNEWNWRFRQELATQLLDIVKIFKPADTANHLGVVAMDLLCDKVAAIRQVAILLIAEIVKYISLEPGPTFCLLAILTEHFAHSKKWKRRQTFCLLCTELMKQQALPAEQFASEMMPHLLDLSWDPVANVRLVVARCLSKYIITNEYFADPCNEHHDGLETVLRRLQADKDIDVRQSAEV